MHLVSSICRFVFVCLSELSCLNCLTFDLDFWHGDRPSPRLGLDFRSRSGSRSRVGGKCQGQINGAQRSILGTRLSIIHRVPKIKFRGSGPRKIKFRGGEGGGIPIPADQPTHPPLYSLNGIALREDWIMEPPDMNLFKCFTLW